MPEREKNRGKKVTRKHFVFHENVMQINMKTRSEKRFKQDSKAHNNNKNKKYDKADATGTLHPLNKV